MVSKGEQASIAQFLFSDWHVYAFTPGKCKCLLYSACAGSERSLVKGPKRHYLRITRKGKAKFLSGLAHSAKRKIAYF